VGWGVAHHCPLPPPPSVLPLVQAGHEDAPVPRRTRRVSARSLRLEHAHPQETPVIDMSETLDQRRCDYGVYCFDIHQISRYLAKNSFFDLLVQLSQLLD